LRHNIVTHSMMAARSRAICDKCYEVPSCTDCVRCEVVSEPTNVFRRPSHLTLWDTGHGALESQPGGSEEPGG